MERILAMSLVGAAPGNVFGPGMSAGALESFAPRGGRGSKAGGGGKRPAGGETPEGGAAERMGEAASKDGFGQEERGGAAASARFEPATGGVYWFEAVAPH
ncbi:hypothetical protein ACP70R_042230 [Stipagrostis hirtigluma subsp. patula]